jgi:hypothetical protein
MAKTKTPRPAPAARPRYGAHPAFTNQEAAFKAKLLERTGKTLEGWVAFVGASGPPDFKVRVAWLKGEHGLGTNYAGWIAERADGKGDPDDYDPEALVDAMYAGPKAALRPIYERLLDLGLALGDDVKACPCGTIVPLYRAHVFAQLKPTTRTRVDLGLALKDVPVTGRLVDTGGLAKKDRITRRIPISRLEEIDDEVIAWLRAAYDLDAGRPS